MTWASADDVNHEVVETIDAALPLIHFSVATELQREMVTTLGKLHDRLAELRAGYASVQNEFNANAAMRAQLLASGFKNFLEMWIALKEDRASDAWNNLIESQEDMRIVQRIHFDDAVDRLISRLLIIEETLFPPQSFLSPGYTFLKALCSICGSVYGECNHVSGRIYMAQICRRVIDEYELQESSLVTNPKDKRCRVEKVGDNGRLVCTLTFREVSNEDNIDLNKLTIHGTLIRKD